MKTYETRPGDTPAIIAKEQLGDRDLWADIVVWNADKCGFMGPHDWYRVGTFLRLPEGAMSAIDHDEIYLQPVCCVNDDIGRLWCEDADPEDCEDGKHWTRYVRADIHESAISELEALRQERDGLLKRDINAIANRICGEIPDGFYIELILENGSGWVSLMHKDEQVDIDMADWNIAEQFNVAMQCADELAKEQGE